MDKTTHENDGREKRDAAVKRSKKKERNDAPDVAIVVTVDGRKITKR